MRIIAFLLLSVVSGLGMAHGAEVAALPPSADAAMYAENGGNGNGGGEFLFVGKNSGGFARRSVLKFDIAGAIPAGATVTGVTLQVTAANTQGTDNVASVYRLTEDWQEGATNAAGAEGGGAAAAAGDTTWTSRNFNTVAWTTAGGSFLVAGADSLNMSGSGTYVWPTSAALVGAVQDWLDTPAGNFGWIVLGDETTAGATAKQIHSRTGTTPPVLTVTYLLASYSPELALSAAGEAVINVGQTITYDLDVSADLMGGDGSDALGLSVTGSESGALAYVSGDTGSDGILAAGETWRFSGSRVALAGDPDTLNNVITVTFEDERGNPHSASASVATAVNHLSIAQTSAAAVGATEGDTVVFSVAASGGYGSYDYAWQFDDGGGAVPVASSNSATLTLEDVGLGQAGSYVCTASDVEESAASDLFTLTVAARVPLGGVLWLCMAAAALCGAGALVVSRGLRAGAADGL